MVQLVKNLPAMRETWVQSPGQEDHLEKEMATHSRTLAWRIPWTQRQNGLQSVEWQSQTWLCDSLSFLTCIRSVKREKGGFYRCPPWGSIQRLPQTQVFLLLPSRPFMHNFSLLAVSPTMVNKQKKDHTSFHCFFLISCYYEKDISSFVEFFINSRR